MSMMTINLDAYTVYQRKDNQNYNITLIQAKQQTSNTCFKRMNNDNIHTSIEYFGRGSNECNIFCFEQLNHFTEISTMTLGSYDATNEWSLRNKQMGVVILVQRDRKITTSY